MARLFAVIVLFIAGAACATGPVYRTNTSYVAPPTAQGASCVASCQTSEQVCKSRMEDYARAEYPACMQRAKATYGSCMRGDYKMGCELARQNAENECSYSLSPNYRSCTSSYNSCYKSCGGEVVEKQVCVKNCDG